MKKTIEITNGPSREELFDGLRLFSEKRLIPFCVKMNEKERFLAVIIDSIQAVDDGSTEYHASGHSWNLTCYANKLLVSEEIFVDKPEKKESGVASKKVGFEFFRELAEENYLLQEYRKNQITVKAYYSTKTRKGTIVVLNEE